MVCLILVAQTLQDLKRRLGLGSPTVTGWKRRSSAASFSMYLRYSIERGRADDADLTAGQGGLEDVRRIHGALGRSGAHDGVQLDR